MFRRVARCENHALYKDFKGRSAIYTNGNLVAHGNEYYVGRKWIDLVCPKR